MSDSKVVTFNLKAVINKQKTRVLFAEVDSAFIDVLFSFLNLPSENFVQAMEKHYGDKPPHAIGSWSTLCRGLSNVYGFLFRLYALKPPILYPECGFEFPFLNRKCTFNRNDDPSQFSSLDKAYFMVHKIFSTEENASFIIRDDLMIAPNGNGSIVQTLKSVGVDMSDIDGAETRNVTFGLNEIMDFLKWLLISSQPLTDVILGGSALKSETGISLPQFKQIPRSAKIYDVKVMLQKSTKKLLFAQAERDFVSFLSILLSSPLGVVDWHLGGNPCLNTLTDNLRRSICDLIEQKNVNDTADIKDYMIKSRTFSYNQLRTFDTELLNAEGSRMYMITDDLIVTRLCVSSAVSLLNEMKISSSDVEEVELHIGSEEALKILVASLVSTNALSDGLFNPRFKTQREVKQEH